MLICFSPFAGKECLNIISRKEFKESEKKQVITIKVNGEVDDRVVVWGKLYDSGSCSSGGTWHESGDTKDE